MTQKRSTVWAAWAVAVLAGWFAGCESSSHKTIRTYDYSNEPRPARQTAHQPTGSADEARIEDTGEMVAPGEMVSPGRMVPPGGNRPADEEEEDEEP